MSTSGRFKIGAMLRIHSDLHEIGILTVRELLISIARVKERILVIREEGHHLYSLNHSIEQYHSRKSNAR